MQNGPYITARILPRVVEGYAKHAHISVQTFSDEWVIRLKRADNIRWIIGSRFDLNQSAAAAVVQDKAAAYAVLRDAGVEAIPHYFVRALQHGVVHTKELHALLDGKPVVVKPLEGASGRAVARFASIDEALIKVRASSEPAWAIAPYYDLQAEYRLIVLDGSILLAYEKTQPAMQGDLKMFNLALGAVAVDLIEGVLLQKLQAIAKQAMQATSLRLATVDIVQLSDGTYPVLEINDGIALGHYAQQSADNAERASRAYKSIVAAMFS